MIASIPFSRFLHDLLPFLASGHNALVLFVIATTSRMQQIVARKLDAAVQAAVEGKGREQTQSVGPAGGSVRVITFPGPDRTGRVPSALLQELRGELDNARDAKVRLVVVGNAEHDADAFAEEYARDKDDVSIFHVNGDRKDGDDKGGEPDPEDGSLTDGPSEDKLKRNYVDETLKQFDEEVRKSFGRGLPKHVLDDLRRRARRGLDDLLAAVLELRQRTQLGSEGAHAQSRLPDIAPELYDETFKRRRQDYRADFLRREKRPVTPLSDEDYTPVRYYDDVWRPIVERTGLPITTRYLKTVDSSLFYALDNYIRQSQRRVRRREPITFADLDIITDREAARLLLKARAHSEA
jgi:hypothetical protein